MLLNQKQNHMNFIRHIGVLLLALMSTAAWAQTVSGTVTDENNQPLPGATVIVQGTNNGTSTDFDGRYQINATQGQTLAYSYVGYATQNVTVSAATHDVMLQTDNTLDEVVVTALGITREKKSLGYAVQSVSGNDVADVKSLNAIESLSGEISGLDIQAYNTMGGSANAVLRGYSSLTENNQVLFVVDGTPINNDTFNTDDAKTGRGGFDYGNAAMDINPDNIASVSVLKGAAASALYGSRASNGVIMITTKKGYEAEGVGLAVNSSLMVGSIDNSTMPVYQKGYAQGYGPYYAGPNGRWNEWGSNLAILTGEDASYGSAYDPNLNVHHWFNMIPEWGDYGKTAPFVAPKTTAHDFFKNSVTYTNSVSLSREAFRIGFTNVTTEGILPNSEIKRNTISFRGNEDFGKLNVGLDVTYTKTQGRGRYGTGYDGQNVFQSFRQWWGTNVDILQQKKVFEDTGKNYSWNMYGLGNPNDDGSPSTKPHYFNNPYWMRYNMYNTDERNRYFGNIQLSYTLNDHFNILGRVAFDQYDDLREERINVGAVDVAKYGLDDRNVSEINYDLILTYNKDFSDDLSFDATLGWNLRINRWDRISVETNGGLNFPNIYSLDNSKNPITPDETRNYDATKKVDGLYGRFSLGYLDTYYIDASYRTDRSSTLPVKHNRYYYPSISGSFILSEVLDVDWISFAKLRANYAEVGNDIDPYRIIDSYIINPSFGGQSSASNASTLNNANLKPERTKEYEFGFEGDFVDNRINLEVSYYNKVTDQLITPVDISGASGATGVYINGGSIENKGVELSLSGKPIVNDNFSWGIKFNYATNKSKVLDLADELEYLELGSAQGGISIGAEVGDPYGVIRGRDFVYHANGGKVIYSYDDAPSSSWVGMYARTDNSDNVIGDINPDWTGSIKNSFRFKNFDASFLIDIQQGGDVFSLDTWYGFATGIYDFTAGTNDLGNPVRNTLANGGGVILDGVNADGSKNTTRANADRFTNPWGYARSSNAAHIYDASFVKLREARIGYNIPRSLLESSPLTSASVSLVGRNLWIISKNTPFTDPEAGLSAGNIQGNQSGAYPAIREVGVNVKLQF